MCNCPSQLTGCKSMYQHFEEKNQHHQAVLSLDADEGEMELVM